MSPEKTWSEKVKEAQTAWMNTRLSRMYHNYDRLMRKVCKLKDEGRWDIVHRAIPRIRHLEHEIEMEEKRQLLTRLRELASMEAERWIN